MLPSLSLIGEGSAGLLPLCLQLQEGCLECSALQFQSSRVPSYVQAWIDELDRNAGIGDHEHLRLALRDVQRAGQLHLGETSMPRWADLGRAALLQRRLLASGADMRCDERPVGVAQSLSHRAEADREYLPQPLVFSLSGCN